MLTQIILKENQDQQIHSQLFLFSGLLGTDFINFLLYEPNPHLPSM